MPKKIDSKMLQIYQGTVSNNKSSKVQEQDALVLIKRAENISKHTMGNCFCPPSERKGSKYLMRLITAKGKHFTSESRQLIRQYINSGRIPSIRQPISYNTLPIMNGVGETTITRPFIGSTRTSTNSNDIIISGGSSRRISTNNLNISSRNIPSENTGLINNETVNEPITNAPLSRLTGTDGVSNVNGSSDVILDWKSTKPTWSCHWFPMQETTPGGDPTNNLYSVNGPLDKLDKITGGKAKGYEWDNNHKTKEAGPAYSWWGHCNNASEASCLLKAPKHGVVMKGLDGSDVKFTKNDIQGLLVKVVPGLVAKTDFQGERFNGSGVENPNDPAPEMFMKVIKDWSKEGLPFVLDIDRTEQVWNFPYDQVKITESTTAPEGVSVNVPNNGAVKYYRIDMEGTGYKEKARVYECYVSYGNDGNVLSSGWLKTPNSHNNPDFMWRPHPTGDLMDKSLWVQSQKSTNPEVNPQVVYDIYMASLS